MTENLWFGKIKENFDDIVIYLMAVSQRRRGPHFARFTDLNFFLQASDF